MTNQPYIPDEDAFAKQLVSLFGTECAEEYLGKSIRAEPVDDPPMPPTILVTISSEQVFRVVVELEGG